MMSDHSELSPYRIRQPKWAILTGIIGAALFASLALEFAAASSWSSYAHVLSWAFIGAVVLNAISLVARWISTRGRRKIFLLGQVPFAIGLIKVATLLIMALLILLLIAALMVGPPFRAVALSALILGMVGSAAVLMSANALLNGIIVLRRFRGTLAETSRETVR
jgi:hypothetical protein